MAKERTATESIHSFSHSIIHSLIMYQTLKEECYEANMQLPKLGLVLFTFGNVSAVDRERGVFAIKPSGVPYDELTPYDIVICDFDANVIEGLYRPSSDTKTHALLYKTWETIGGIAHTHSTYAVAWAQAGMDIPIFGTTHADHTHQDIPCAPGTDRRHDSGRLRTRNGQPDFQRVSGERAFAERHGDGAVAEPRSLYLGQNGGQSRLQFGSAGRSSPYGPADVADKPPYPRIKDTLRLKHYERKHGPNAYYGQEE